MLKRLGVHVVKEGKKWHKSLPLSDKVVSELAKQKILELALKYHLSTKYTSWVAINTESDRTIIHNTVVTSLASDMGDYLLAANRVACPGQDSEK